MPLIEYVEKIKGSSKHPLYKFTYLLFFFLLPIFGLYKSYPLKNNLVLEICKKKNYTKFGL
jgi:hypothetical protein